MKKHITGYERREDVDKLLTIVFEVLLGKIAELVAELERRKR